MSIVMKEFFPLWYSCFHLPRFKLCINVCELLYTRTSMSVCGLAHRFEIVDQSKRGQ